MTIVLSNTYTFKKTHIFNKTYITNKDCKDQSYIIYFNYNKKSYYISTYTKPKENSDNSDN